MLLAIALLAAQATAPNPLDALLVYNGTWHVKVDHPFSGGPAGTVDTLESHCTRTTAFVTCEQSVNGKVLELMVYTAAPTPGHFYTKFIQPDNMSAPRGELILDGNHFTYLDKATVDGKATLYRVENIFRDRDHIHFEESNSTDGGKTWTTTNQGEETRVR